MKHSLHSILACLVLIALSGGYAAHASAWFPFTSISPAGLTSSIQKKGAASSSALRRKAERLQSRLAKHGYPVASVSKLEAALLERQRLFTQQVDIAFSDPSLSHWSVSLHQYPTWMILNARTTMFEVDLTRITETIETFGLPGTTKPVDAEVLARKVLEGVNRVDTNGKIAKAGWTYNTERIAKQIQTSLEQGMTSITVDATPTTGKIYLDGQELTLLGTGHSDFSTSIWSRMVNVRKAVSNVHNAIVEPGEVFSFNDILDYPIAPSNGWPEAKVIFGGWELRDAPGGGICQSSTTTYRAAAYAGLPILKRKNHSLYVHYYEKHGIGLDATVFPGKQDFTFLNDTGAPLVLQAFTDGFDAYVHIYGKNDGRAVTLEGPYFGANAPADMLVNNRPVRRNEIVWVRTISRPDGTVTREQFVSNYNAVPTSIVKKYTEDISMAAR